jgi:hypothetical protein
MIEHYEFGWYIIDGKRYEYDITIINGKVGTWQRNGHVMTVDNVKELVEKRPEAIVIGNGADGRVSVGEDITGYIKKHGIKLIVAKTAEACEEFNDLEKQGKKVFAILHATC